MGAWTQSRRYEILTEGGLEYDSATLELTGGWLKAALIETGARGLWTGSDGETITEESTKVTFIVPTCASASWARANLCLLPVDRELMDEGRDFDYLKLAETYVLELARSIRETNDQECVLVVRTDRTGVKTIYI